VSFIADKLVPAQPEVETACFRVAQDAVTNVMKHAQARRMRMELHQQNGALHLLVGDDGIGFDVARQRSRATGGASMGLLSMEERAVLAGGGLEITSAHARGTEVRAWFPLGAPAEPETHSTEGAGGPQPGSNPGRVHP
jgi:signal transduction histidine kinase